MVAAASPLVRSTSPVAITDGAPNTTMSAEVRSHMGTTAVRVMSIVIEVRYTVRRNPGVHKRTARSATSAKIRAVQSGTVFSSGPSYSFERYELMSCC